MTKRNQSDQPDDLKRRLFTLGVVGIPTAFLASTYFGAFGWGARNAITPQTVADGEVRVNRFINVRPFLILR